LILILCGLNQVVVDTGKAKLALVKQAKTV